MAKAKKGIKFIYIIYIFIALVVISGIIISIQLRIQNTHANKAAEYNDFLVDTQIKANNEIAIMDTKFSTSSSEKQAKEVLDESERFLQSLITDVENSNSDLENAEEFKKSALNLLNLYLSILQNEYRGEIMNLKYTEGLNNIEIKQKHTEIFEESNIKLAEYSANFTTAQKEFAAVNGVRLVEGD